MPRNTFARRLLVMIAVAMLSLPSALGVQKELEPTRGDLGSWSGAAGIEALYLGIALLFLSPELRKYARRVARGAVTAAVLLNVVFDYRAHMQVIGHAGALNSATEFMATFDWLILIVAIIESLPLAGLAYLGSELLTRVASEQPSTGEAWKLWSKAKEYVKTWFNKPQPQNAPSTPPVVLSPAIGPTIVDVVRKVMAGARLTSDEHRLLRDEIGARKVRESRHQTILDLFAQSGGPLYIKAGEIYDRYVENTNGVTPHV